MRVTGGFGVLQSSLEGDGEVADRGVGSGAALVGDQDLAQGPGRLAVALGPAR
jgi:hypothetical protein